jgi:hypothetical protein
VRHGTAESLSMGWFGYSVDTYADRRTLETVREPEGESLHLADLAVRRSLWSGPNGKRERNVELASRVARVAFTLALADNVAP